MLVLKVIDSFAVLMFVFVTSALAIEPHPDAVPSTHQPGDVDVAENVPFNVTDPATLRGIVMDETAAVLKGSWQYSTHTPPYVGIGYLHDQKSDKGEKSVTWTPDFPNAGKYEVRVSHCCNVRRSNNTPVIIRHAHGESIIRINQQEVPAHGKLFRSLGVFEFEAGKIGSVTISNEGADGKYVIADAVQFLPQRSSRVEEPPVYVRNEEDHSKWPQIVREGVDAARDYFGNYGPVQVYILGHEEDALNSDAFHKQIVERYCQCRHPDSIDDRAGCASGSGAELLRKALSGRGDAYLSFVDHTRPPLAELVFINPHEFNDPYLYTRGIHEYTHVYQRAFPVTPTWMMEGGAEFFACYLGEKRGWASLRNDMKTFMENVRRIEDPELGIQHMEEIDKVSLAIKKYHRHLAYDAGAWAIAFMIHHSRSQSIADMHKKFYPRVTKIGWEAALAEYVQMKDKQAFYHAFEMFLAQPWEQQLSLVGALND